MVERRQSPESWFDSRQSKAGCLDRLSTAWDVMNNTQKLIVYQCQVKNVRALESSINHLRRSINSALRENREPISLSFTKLYAITFCAWAEANFSKVVHTPYGFNLDEIRQIHSAKASGIASAWKKAVELGVRHLDARRGNFRPNALQRLERAIDKHVFDPSLLRNKLAHGQWVQALNRDNDEINADLTRQIFELDIVKVDGWLSCHKNLAHMVETLIESPKKAFVRDWWLAVEELDNAMENASSRSLVDHIAKLKAKDIRTNAHEKRRGR